MSDSNSYSKRAYLGIAKESTVNTAVYPNVFVELLSEDVVVNHNTVESNQIAGSREMRLRPIKNTITAEGSITFLVEPNTIGYFLTALFGAPTTTTLEAATSFQHVFTPQNTLVTYTMDIAAAGLDYVRRFTGVYVQSIELSQSDNKIQCTLNIMARGAFDTSKVTTAVSSGTTLNLDQTSALTTSDTLNIIDKDDNETEIHERTVASITSELELEVGSAISSQVDVGDFVTIKRNTSVTYTLEDELIWIGGTTALIGDDINNTSADNVEDFSVTLNNELEPRYTASGSNQINRFPSAIKVKGFNAEGSIKRCIENAGLLDDLRQARKRGIRLKMNSAAIASNAAAAASVTIGTGNGAITVTADTAGEAGNDINLVAFALNSSDDLSASKSGNTITVLLANSTGSKNTATLVAAAVDALSGVSCSAGGTGADQMVIGDNAVTTNLASGRDANEVAQLRVDFLNAIYQPFAQNNSEDNVVEEDAAFLAYKEPDTTYGYSTRLVLRNAISSY